MKRWIAAIALLVVCFGAVVGAKGAILFENGVSALEAQGVQGAFGVYIGPSYFRSWYPYDDFTVSAPGWVVNSISFYLCVNPGTGVPPDAGTVSNIGNKIHVNIRRDSGSVPGDLVASFDADVFDVRDLGRNWGTYAEVFTLSLDTHNFQIDAGKYFLNLFADHADIPGPGSPISTAGVWWGMGRFPENNNSYYRWRQQWYDEDQGGQIGPYFTLEGRSAIPEPTTLIIWSLLGALAICIGWWRKRRVMITSVAVLVVLSGVGLAEASIDSFGTGANQFTIDFVTISGATNPTGGIPAGAYFTFTGVNSTYRISTYEVTNDQWNKFRAAYGAVMGSPASAYASDPYFTNANVPANCVSWYEAAQFVNWLNTSTGHHAAYNFTGTQGTSDYTFVTWSAAEAADGTNLYRHKDAFYFLPTENEWVKAAYWNGTTLQQYATKGDTFPPQATGANGTGWSYITGPPYQFATDPPGPWNVGSGIEELNGTYDMMGNVWEWTESPVTDTNYGASALRGMRGGSYTNGWEVLGASPVYYFPSDPALPSEQHIGFRVASAAESPAVPEPSTLIIWSLLGTLALGSGCWRKWRIAPVVAVCCLGIALGSSDANAAIYDVRTDFSTTNNPAGAWSYGHSLTLGGAMTLFPHYLPPPSGYQGAAWCDRTWYDEYNNYNNSPAVFGESIEAPWGFVYEMQPGEIAFHPGPGSDYTIIRWTAPSDGIGNITSLFLGKNSIGLRDIAVYHNGTQLLATTLAGDAIVPYNATVIFQACGAQESLTGIVWESMSVR